MIPEEKLIRYEEQLNDQPPTNEQAGGYGLTAKNSLVNRQDMSHMTLISMPTLHLTQISKLEPFPQNFQNTMIGFHSRKMYKFIYKQISPKTEK